ncbi:MAG: TonB-dependent receptor [Prevotella sp.]
MKRLLLFFAFTMSAMFALAQRAITGTTVESDSQEPLPQATVKLLKTDSTLVKGVLTNVNGVFKITAPADGRYILRVSCVGFKNYTKRITVSGGKDVALGKINMSADAIMLKGTTVTANVAKVQAKGDTLEYNAAAYRTPEGSAIEELVKRLPGVTVGDDGTITHNGKTVKKILVDGKEFMTGDTQTAMKNLPTYIIEKVKAYDQKSDLARVSGIDDGEEETVLDFSVKHGMNKGMFSNLDLAAGTRDRYAAKAMAARFQGDSRIMVMGNANNTNDMGFPGGGGRGNFGGGRNGLNASKMLGMNFNYEQKDKLKINGSVRWNHRDGDVVSKGSSENFVSETSSFSNNLNQNYTRSDSWNAQMRLEWMPDTMTNILFRPEFSYSKNDGTSISSSATFNDDPYVYVQNPLSPEGIAALASNGLIVNSQNNGGITYGDSKRVGGTLQFNRKLNSKGRNVTLKATANYSESGNKSLSTTNVHLYQIKDALGNDSTYQTNRYNLTPQKNWSYSAEATYSEPIFKSTYLQFRYMFKYDYSKSDRQTYDFSNLGEDFFSGLTPEYRQWNSYIGRLVNPLESYLDDDLSRYSEYKNFIHNLELMLRIIQKSYTINLGVKVVPQETDFIQHYQGVNTDTVRHVTNVTPTADIRWKISPFSQLRFNYRGSTSQPNMTDLLDIVDDSNPLSITMGNPGLKPSFTNNLMLFYNNYIQKHQRTLMANVFFNTTRNSVSRMITYNPETGGQISRPENINGNWNINSGFMFNTALDTLGIFYVNTMTDFGYNHSVGYLNLNRSATAQKNSVNTTSIGERLAAGIRNSWLEFELTGSLNYTHARNQLQPESNLDTWQFSYGFNTNVQLPWGTTLATDLSMNSRRGFNDASMNTNELIWNVQLSQSFLRGKALTLTLQFYDLLHNQSNISRTINSMMRSDTEYNSITNYVMVHAIYRLNVFGGKQAREQMRQPHGDRMQGPPPGMGGRGGNFGGGRPPRGGFGGF